MSVILGLNAYHADSSACVVVDGRLVACAEEERFCRVKHWAGLPVESIRYCLSAAGVDSDQQIHVAVNSSSTANAGRKICYALSHPPRISLLLAKWATRRERGLVHERLAAALPQFKFSNQVVNVEHHLAHLASAYFAGPWDEAITVSFDGFGDFASAAWGSANMGEISVKDHIWFPHSMGIFYQAITQFLGFPSYGDEYKVMGLASYGSPSYGEMMRELVVLKGEGRFELNLDYFSHARDNISHSWAGCAPEFSLLYARKLESLLGPAREYEKELTQRHMDIASSAQAIFEETFFHFLNWISKQHPCRNLVLAGGCAMNSVANGGISSHTPFKNVYVQSGAGDAGGAIGAALIAAAKLSRVSPARGQMPHAYWGPEFRDEVIAAVIASRQHELVENNCKVVNVDTDAALCKRVSQAIASGLVVGWFQGRMEWGARALGNRSILCDPRRADMKNILNAKIKRRESFRPFAPSILRERVREWFERDDDVPFMMKVYSIRESKRRLIPAVVHVDGTGRLQTVTRRDNRLYYHLICEFEALTGIPIVLNTSFNENEPIVCSPDEALECFLRTKMDLLVLGRTLIRRNTESSTFDFRESAVDIFANELE